MPSANFKIFKVGIYEKKKICESLRLYTVYQALHDYSVIHGSNIITKQTKKIKEYLKIVKFSMGQLTRMLSYVNCYALVRDGEN